MDGPLLKFTHPVSIHRSAVAPKHATRNARVGQEQMKRNTPGMPHGESPNRRTQDEEQYAREATEGNNKNNGKLKCNTNM